MVFVVEDDEVEHVERAGFGHARQTREHVRVGARACVDGDEPFVRAHVVAGVFERRPRAFEEDALLRVHPLGHPRRDVEEGGVEHLHVFEHALGLDECRVGEVFRREADLGGAGPIMSRKGVFIRPTLEDG